MRSHKMMIDVTVVSGGMLRMSADPLPYDPNQVLKSWEAFEYGWLLSQNQWSPGC